MHRTLNHRPSFLELDQFKESNADYSSLDAPINANEKEKSLDAQRTQFMRKFKLLLNDQIKRKEIIDQIQILARKKHYRLDDKPAISNENYKFEWFVATGEPTLIDSLYYLYFWVLLKGKYLLDDIDEESVNRLKKKQSFYQLNYQNANNASSANGSSESIFFESPSKLNSIANHHSATRFEKDILKAKKSVGDLRSQFAKIIDDEKNKENVSSSATVSSFSSMDSLSPNTRYHKLQQLSARTPSTTPRKASFGNSLTPSASPSSKKFNNNNSSANDNSANGANGSTLAKKFSELNLMDSPYIKNVLKFKFEMTTYLNILIDNYNLNNEVLPLEFLLDFRNLPLSRIVYRDGQVNEDIVHRIPGYQYLLLIAENPIDTNCSAYLKFVHEQLIQHLQAGLVWDIHSIYQNTGKLHSDIQNVYINEESRSKYFQNFNKILTNLIFEFYKNKQKREEIVKEFNLNPKHHIKIPLLKLNYSILKFNETWKNWTELDFVALNNLMFPSKKDDNHRLISKRAEYESLKIGESMSYYAWDIETDQQIELEYIKT